MDLTTGERFSSGLTNIYNPFSLLNAFDRIEISDLDFPNNEVRQGFLSMIANSYLKPKDGNISSWVIDALILLEDRETAEFRDSLTAFLSSIA